MACLISLICPRIGECNINVSYGSYCGVDVIVMIRDIVIVITSVLLYFCSGTYKPRIRCYDVHDLSLKFERCLDSEGKKQ